jgi:hypothetical protein
MSSTSIRAVLRLNRLYVFVVVAKPRDESYDDYRQYRMAVLHAYVQTAKLKAPLGTVFVGIAFDNPRKDYQGGTEDLFVLMKDTWSAVELDELEIMRHDLQLWGDAMELWQYRQDEFPQADQLTALRRVMPSSPEAQRQQQDRRKAEKRLRKMKQSSKRQNRSKKKS